MYKKKKQKASHLFKTSYPFPPSGQSLETHPRKEQKVAFSFFFKKKK